MFKKMHQNLGKIFCMAAVGSAASLSGGCAVCSAEKSDPPLTDEKSRMAAIENYLNTQGKIESIKTVKVKDSELLLICYVLTPSPHSYIRCGIALPKPEVWSGRFIGLGNTGFPTSYAQNFYNWTNFVKSTGCTEHLAGNNNAVVTCDMGFARHREKNPEVWKDFGFRATHLMTVSAKEIIKLYYGKAADYNYFFGLSTGGGQGMHEAQKFPEDYDGIISIVPASTRLYLLASNIHIHRAIYDKNGKRLFSSEQLKTIRQAAVKYYADKVPAYAANKFIPDPRYNAEAAKNIAKIAGEMDPAITPELQKRIEKLFSPIYINNRYAGEAVPFGGADLQQVGSRFTLIDLFFGKGFDVNSPDADSKLEELFKVMSPIFNAENTDLKAFRKRGGKLIVCSGTEDCIVPYAAFWDYYQRAAAAAGGVEKLKKNFLYYLLPGRSHTYGNGVRSLKNIDQALFDWVEKDIRPDELTGVTKTGREIPVYPYPMMTVGDKKTGYSAVPFPEIKTPERDKIFTASMSANEAQKECLYSNQKIKYPKGSVTDFWGYKRYNFTFEGRKCFIVAPKKVAPGVPWLWGIQWPTAFIPRTPTLLLLEKGWHYVHIDLYNTGLNEEGIEIADRFYKMLQSISFAPRMSLNGLSFGGLFSLRWAVERPATVNAIYLDAPMTAPYSKKPATTRFLAEKYHCKDKAELIKSPLSPHNRCKDIAHIPIIAIRHGEDQTVPNEEHFDVFVEKFKAAGGNIIVINHSFYGHHPHGLDDPKKLADFMEKHNR